MKESALQEYTKQKKLYGQNEEQILAKFVQYASHCSDPISVYRYMEEKSICIYLASYWAHRAILFSQMGDFRDAILCIKEAQNRNQIVNEHEVRIEDFLQKIKRKMVAAMKRVPPKSKRSANQYNFLYEKQGKITVQNLEAMVETFEKGYKEAKKDIEKEFSLKMHGKNKSWMSSIYEQNEENLRKLSERMKSLSNIETFLSMRTPISKKDPMRLTKTMDSVELLKKKKSTQPKQSRKAKLCQNNSETGTNKEGNPEYQSEDQMLGSDHEDHPICVNTTPVGRQLSMLSRRVTFNTKSRKYDSIEKLRNDQQASNKETPNMEAEGQEKVVDLSKSISRRGSILKNKKMHYMEEQN